MRKFQFQNGYYYHIYNRGVDKRDIFCDGRDYIRFIVNLREFNNESKYCERDYEKRKLTEKEKLSFGYPKLSFLERFSELPKLVEFVCYSLLPNHYHFVLKQLADKGIEIFMHKLGIGYTKYFNNRYYRTGSLFGSTYKAIKVDTNEYLLYLTGYINGNAQIHKVAKGKNGRGAAIRII